MERRQHNVHNFVHGRVVDIILLNFFQMTFHYYQGKVVAIGNSVVGKTSLVKLYTSLKKDFNKSYIMTSGVDAYSKVIRFENSNDTVELLIYDTTGFDIYYGTLTKYWVQPDMLLLIYDVTSQSSFDELKQWLDLAHSIKWNKNLDSPIISVLFGNKTDLKARRIITEDMGKEVADKYNIYYFEGSAKTNEGVNELFQFFAEQWYNYCSDSTVKKEMPIQKSSIFSSFQVSDDYY